MLRAVQHRITTRVFARLALQRQRRISRKQLSLFASLTQFDFAYSVSRSENLKIPEGLSTRRLAGTKRRRKRTVDYCGVEKIMIVRERGESEKEKKEWGKVN